MGIITGLAPVSSLFLDPYKGLPALFLLEMGPCTAGQLCEWRSEQSRVVAFAAPALPVWAGLVTGMAPGLPQGSVLILGVTVPLNVMFGIPLYHARLTRIT